MCMLGLHYLVFRCPTGIPKRFHFTTWHAYKPSLLRAIKTCCHSSLRVREREHVLRSGIVRPAPPALPVIKQKEKRFAENGWSVSYSWIIPRTNSRDPITAPVIWLPSTFDVSFPRGSSCLFAQQYSLCTIKRRLGAHLKGRYHPKQSPHACGQAESRWIPRRHPVEPVGRRRCRHPDGTGTDPPTSPAAAAEPAG